MTMNDKYLLEAMREVDAMLPGTPPIAPPESAYEKADRVFGLRDEVERRGVSWNSGAALMMQNAARRYMHAELANQHGRLNTNTATFADGTTLEAAFDEQWGPPRFGR